MIYKLKYLYLVAFPPIYCISLITFRYIDLLYLEKSVIRELLNDNGIRISEAWYFIWSWCNISLPNIRQIHIKKYTLHLKAARYHQMYPFDWKLMFRWGRKCLVIIKKTLNWNIWVWEYSRVPERNYFTKC
jgi:hypothetical protein